jgi:hypothetical protein
VAVVQYTFTYKQYTERHNETEYTEQNTTYITISIHKQTKRLLCIFRLRWHVGGLSRAGNYFVRFGTITNQGHGILPLQAGQSLMVCPELVINFVRIGTITNQGHGIRPLQAGQTLMVCPELVIILSVLAQ